MALTAATLCVPVRCHAQSPDSFTFDAAAGTAHFANRDGISNGPTFQIGAGYAVTAAPTEQYDADSKLLGARRWRIFLTGDFFYDQSRVYTSALSTAILLNPQTPALLSATSANAKYYSATFDPTVRVALRRRFDVYALGGFGWFHRSVDFSGSATQGNLLQPGSASVFGSGGNSGVIDGAVGVDIGLTRSGGRPKLFVEARVLHGLAINGGSTLVPLTAGFRW